MKQTLADMHYRPLPWAFRLLKPLAWAYGMAVTCRLAAYTFGWLKPTTVEIPVLSVGNLTTGGTGKTPVVLALGEALLAMGYRVVILSRGYGAQDPIAYGRATRPEVGDEAYLLQQALPQAVVIVGRDRASNAKRAIAEYQPDVILLDDGFQYLKLARTHNIMLVDGERQFGNKQLLPLGPLREPLSQLRRADALWWTKAPTNSIPADFQQLVQAKAGKTLPISIIPFKFTGLVSVATQTTIPLTALKSQPVLAISGIAQPKVFENALKAQGAEILQHAVFNDHHVYRKEDLTPLLATCPPEAWLVTTEKDWVKLQGLLPNSCLPSVYTLKMQPVFDFRAYLHGIGFPDRHTSSTAPSPSETHPGDALSLHRGYVADSSISAESSTGLS